MCGIVGFNWADRRLVKRMADQITYRGPDGQGYFVDTNVSLGNRRLAILDLRALANMPMSDTEGEVWITYNGEIYNFRELRADLEKKGYRFRTNSDTEVIIYAYKAYGFDCVKKFLGMFAFCIYDARRRLFFLARDHLGIKPLYYYHLDSRFVFASEIKSLLVCDQVHTSLHKQALAQTLRFRYPPFTDTLFTHIKKVPAGSYLVFSKNNLQITRYWDITEAETSSNFHTASDRLLELLTTSVRYHLISDVPVGCFLSGGIDSSFVTALAAKQVHDRLKAFSVDFDHFSESSYASLLTKYATIDHQIIHVTEKDVLKHITTLAALYEEPMTEVASLPTYIMSKEVRRQGIKVVLSGDGADEIFGGYDHYFSMQRLHRLSYFLPRLPFLEHFLPGRLRRFFQVLRDAQTPATAYLYFNRFFKQDEILSLFVTVPDTENIRQRLMDELKHFTTFFNSILYLDVRHQLAEYFLMKLDKATMAASLESRVPYVTPAIASFAFQLSSSLKCPNAVPKALLRHSARSLLPKEILTRKKQGYGVPLDVWMRSSVGALVEQTLTDKSLLLRSGLFRKAAVQRILAQRRNDLHHAQASWTLFALEQFFQNYRDALFTKSS